MKCERLFAQVYFSNETVSHTTVSTGPMKMFRLEHETMNVCQKYVAHFWSRGCRFDKINDIFPAGLFCRLQVAGCRLKFHYNWKTADTKKKHTSVRLTVTDT